MKDEGTQAGPAHQAPGTLCSRTRTRRFVASAGAALCIGALLAACGSSSSAAKTSSKPKLAKAPFHIENIGDFSGSDAEQNVPEAAGLRAWAEVVNNTGGIDGHPVDLSFCDAASSVTNATSCASGVPSNVGVVVEEGVAGELKAAPPILQGKGKLVLTDVPTANPAPGTNLFQVSPPLASDIAAVLALAKRNGITTIGVVTTSDATGVAVTKSFAASASKFGAKATTQYLATGSVDATVQVTQLEQDHVQMLYVGTLGEPAVATLQAAHTLGWTKPIFVLPADVTQTFIGLLGTAMPTHIYGQPPSAFQLPAVLTGQDLANFDQLEAQYKKITGKAWNTQQQGPITAFLGSLAGTVMSHLGADPNLSAAESFLRTGTVDTPLGPIAFPSTIPFQDGNLPAPIAEATASPLQWGPCQTNAELKC